MLGVQSLQWLGLLAILAFLIALGRALIDHKIHLASLRGAFNFDRRLVVSWVRPEQRRPLPSIDGVALAPEREVTGWGAHLPGSGGLMVVLNAHVETSWVLAGQLGSSKSRLASEVILVVLGTPSRALRLLRTTEIDNRNLVFLGQSSDALDELGIRWTPAVIGVRDGLVCSIAQVFSIGQLMEFERALIEEVMPASSASGEVGHNPGKSYTRARR